MAGIFQQPANAQDFPLALSPESRALLKEHLRQRLESWLLRVWFDQPQGADRLLAGVAAPLFLPLSALVAALARRRARQIRRLPPDSPPPAVIVVGNLVVGGSGKTPLVLALCHALTQQGLRVGLLARGYRTDDEQPRLVDASTPVSVAGDEALLLAMQSGCPVAVCPRRKAALDLLTTRHPGLDVVISDDGLQHTGLPRRLELVVMPATGIGNGRCLPAGPLREPVERLAHVDALLLPDSMPTARREALWRAVGQPVPQAAGASTARESAQPGEHASPALAGASPTGGAVPLADRDGGSPPAPTGVPRVFTLRTEIRDVRRLDGSEQWTPGAFARAFAGRETAAVAGISRPERFFDSLTAMGLEISRHPLTDHAPIDPGWLAALPQPDIIMTAKDAVKCLGFPERLRRRCLVLGIDAVPDAPLLEWLLAELSAASSS